MTERHLEFLSLKGSFTGSCLSILVKMPHCWKSHAAAQLNGTTIDQNNQIHALIQRGDRGSGLTSYRFP